jgi:hypothetical protein
LPRLFADEPIEGEDGWKEEQEFVTGEIHEWIQRVGWKKYPGDLGAARDYIRCSKGRNLTRVIK